MVGFNSQPPEGGWQNVEGPSIRLAVSTHSRPKAAGYAATSRYGTYSGFNSQPPEGGWTGFY